jgi:hypothetical protein
MISAALWSAITIWLTTIWRMNAVGPCWAPLHQDFEGMIDHGAASADIGTLLKES